MNKDNPSTPSEAELINESMPPSPPTEFITNRQLETFKKTYVPSRNNAPPPPPSKPQPPSDAKKDN